MRKTGSPGPYNSMIIATVSSEMKYIWLIIFFAVLICFRINPKDYFTWFLEVMPALIGFLIFSV